MIEEIKEDKVVKENSEEISIPRLRAQARNLEKKTVLPMYLFHVPSSTNRYFLINHINLKKIMEAVHQESVICK